MRKNWKNKSIVHSRQSIVDSRPWSVVKGLWTLMYIIFLASSCSTDKHAEHVDTYTCPMHPTVVSDRPSTCPVCGMDLVRKAKPGEEIKITEDLARLIKSPNEVVIASVKTIKPEYKAMTASVQAQGIVTYDTRYVYNIPARIGGRLEKVYLRYAFQPVRKGQKVADIYSPELLTAQRELLYLVEKDKDNEDLIRAAKNKLLLLGASEKQVEEIIARKEPTYTFAIYSVHDGYVVNETQQAPAMVSTLASAASSSMGGGMDDGGNSVAQVASSSAQATGELTREGVYVTTGQNLFKIVSGTALRIELNLPTAQAGSVKAGDKISLNLGDGKTEEVKVDFVQPFFSDGEEFVKIRVYVRSTERLRIGQLVSATLDFQTSETLWLPKEAVLDMGVEKVVFVKERGVFKPKKIVTGIRTNRLIEVKQELTSSDEVAANAQYMVDSESFIKSK